MGQNSIRTNIKKDEIIAEIRLTLSAKPKTPIIVVEGKDDVRFVNRFFVQEALIKESPAGKPDVINIVGFFQDKISVIGICDRDYDENEPPSKIFFYDYSCLEVMLFTENVSKKIFKDLHVPDRISRHQILSQLTWLSCFRKASAIYGWSVNFGGLSINKAFDGKEEYLNNEILKISLKEKNSDTNLFSSDRNKVTEDEMNNLGSLNDLMMLVNGHDLRHLIQSYHSYYASQAGSKVLHDTVIYEYILLPKYCESGEFISSALYSAVSKFCDCTNQVFLLYEYQE